MSDPTTPASPPDEPFYVVNIMGYNINLLFVAIILLIGVCLYFFVLKDQPTGAGYNIFTSTNNSTPTEIKNIFNSLSS